MIVTFCGHSDFNPNEAYEQKLLDILVQNIGDMPACLYLGEYGNFDAFAYRCAKKYQAQHPNVSLAFVTPYLTEEYQKNHLGYQKTRYDQIIYPDIENVPLRFAIVHRNRYMVDKADLLIAFIDHTWGGAYNTYTYAKRKKKTIFNLADSQI